MNSNFLVLIPKTFDAVTVDNLRPIILGNFLYKIISDCVAVISFRIISHNQFDFIKERHIEECIAAVSECVNLVDRCGNVVFKIDIKKTFDTLSWLFLLSILRAFRFLEKLCSWISTILYLAIVLVLVNRSPYWWFSCSRGVRQVDPLSPLLFCLEEEFLSWSITLLVQSGLFRCLLQRGHGFYIF